MNCVSGRVGLFREKIIAAIQCLPDDQATRTELHSMPLQGLLSVYVNWADRYVMPRPRSVSFASDFWNHSEARNYREVIVDLAKQIECGQDITGYLSRRAHTGGYRAHKEKNSAANDVCLNSYSVHHLHLGSTRQTNGLIERTKHVLFVRFSRIEAHFLLIGDHKSFYGEALLSHIRDLREAEGLTLQGILPSVEWTAAERWQLGQRGISTATSRDGSALILSLLATNGMNLRVIKHASAIAYYVGYLDSRLDDPSWVETFLGPLSAKDSEPSFFWSMNLCDLTLCEESGKRFITLVPWIR